MNAKSSTVLTNLQRGNVKQENLMLLYQRTLHELAAQGELYNINPDNVDNVDSNNMTPLFWAAGYGQNAAVELLIKSGANLNHKAIGGKTVLMYASSKGFFYVVRTLIADGANLNDKDNAGNSALMYAAHQNHPLVIQELIKYGADLSIMNDYGQTAYSISILKHNKAAQAAIEKHMLSLLTGNS